MFASARRTRSFPATVLVIAAALLLGACGGDGDDAKDDSKSASKAPRCGATTVDGVDIVRPCGKASGEIAIDGDVVAEFTRGSCTGTADSVVLNLGDTVVGANPSKRDLERHDNLSILAGRYPAASKQAAPVSKDGTYSAGVLMSSVIKGRTLALQKTKLVLSGNRNNGTFSGPSTEGEQVEGSFSCGG